MIYVGMIFRYDSEDGNGTMMFSGGEKRDFYISSWVDDENQPSIGQKVSYEIVDNTVKIKVADIDDAITDVPPEISEKDDSKDSTNSFNSMDEYVTYYTNMGFKLVKKFNSNPSENLTFRKLEMGEPIEVTINMTESKIVVTTTVNGKQVD